MHLHQLGKIELGLLEDLDLADVAVVDGEDGGTALLLDLSGENLGERDAGGEIDK